MEPGDEELGMDAAVPIGLICTELATNSIKHAFPGGKAVTITIKLSRQADETVLLAVEDDGIGFDPESTKDSETTLGLKLIDALVHQLEARMDISGSGGARFELRFRER